jgi:hypothetical protein
MEDTVENYYQDYIGPYEQVSDLEVGQHRVWSYGSVSILYYDIGDEWVIVDNIDVSSIDDNSLINSNSIVAYCLDDGSTSDPSECSSNCWISSKDSSTECIDVSLAVIDTMDDCKVFTTTTEAAPETTSATEDGDGSKSNANHSELKVWHYVLIILAILAFPLCIVIFVVVQRRKHSAVAEEDGGIALQPYVPTGMANYSSQQNQDYAQEAKKKMSTQSIKDPAPTETMQ